MIDYLLWVNYEFDGRIKMNPVSRDIFFRFCPFKAQTRKELAQKPLYANLDMKYQNRARKNILKIESRLRKFEKAN